MTVFRSARRKLSFCQASTKLWNQTNFPVKWPAVASVMLR
jgi:hypothetical protein